MLKEERFRLDIRKNVVFFTIQAVRHWHRLSRKGVDASSQGQAGGALSTNGAACVPVPCRERNQVAFRSPFHIQTTL